MEGVESKSGSVSERKCKYVKGKKIGSVEAGFS